MNETEGKSTDEQTLLVTKRFNVVRTSSRVTNTRREVIRHPGAVVILPILDNGSVCLIRNYRVAVDRTLLELPAGTLEPGEPIEQCARRELIEETGYRAEHFELLTTFFVSPGILDERMYLFKATGLTAGEQKLEADEQIQTAPTPWAEAVGMAADGRIIDAKTIIGLLLADRTG